MIFFFKMIINARHFCYHKLCCAVQFFWLVYKNCICECLKIKCYNFCWILFLCSRADPGRGGGSRGPWPLPSWKIQTCQIYILKSQKMGPRPSFPSKTKLFLERTKAGNLDPCILHCFVNNWREKMSVVNIDNKGEMGHFRLFVIFENRFLLPRNKICILKRASFHTVYKRS